MAIYRTRMMASSIAFAISLAACGGGGGSSGVAFIPASPAAPTAPRTSAIAAPALAGVPNSTPFPKAVVGGPTLSAHPKTVFPLLQSVVSIGPAGVVADTATINAGATLTFDSSDSSYDIDIRNLALGVSNLRLSATPSGVFEAVVSRGNHVFLEISNPNNDVLSWTSFGFWDVAAPTGSRTQSAFVTGYETPAGSLPTSGSASYHGLVRGEVLLPQAGRENGVNYLALSGDSRLVANFASGSVSGSLTNMFATDFEGARLPWNSVSLAATFSGGQNMFTGTSAVTSAPGNSASLANTATGTVAGKFFGPNAEEIGAVWTLSDGVSAAFGTIVAKAGDVCAGCWDY